MTPPSCKPDRLAWTLVVLAAGCTQQVASSFPTASAHPDEDRRPDGIAVDLTSEPPPWTDRADASASVVTLRAPLGVEAALRAVDAFFDSIFKEDANAMVEVVPHSALLHDLKNTNVIHSATSLWRQRFYKYEYQQLTTSLVYRASDVTTYHSAQLGELPLTVRYLDPSTTPEPTDVVLRVPIIAHSIKNERYFGDEIYFWLRREADRYVIYRMAEDVPI